MSAIKGFFIKYKKILTFLFLITICFVLMFSSTQKLTSQVKNRGFTILSPFHYIFHSIGKFFQGTFNSISQLKKTQQEMTRLRDELKQIKMLAIDFTEIKKENEELYKLLNLKEKTPYQSVACEIMGRDPKNLFDILILNKGSQSGIKKNSPVISYAGGKRILVGKIIETHPFTSKVITLQNPTLSVSAIIQSNSIHTVIQGDNKKAGLVKLLYIPKAYEFVENSFEIVATSGDSTIYPKGLEIGQIIRVYPTNKYENFNIADVKMTVQLDKLEYVLVLNVDVDKDNYKILEDADID